MITATFIGYLVGGITGAHLSTVAIFLPIYAGGVLPGRWFLRHKDYPQVKAFVKGATGDPDGTGTATMTVSPATGRVCFTIATRNIDTPRRAHIHHQVAGQNGPITVALYESSPSHGGPLGGCPAAPPRARPKPGTWWPIPRSTTSTCTTTRTPLVRCSGS